MGRMEDFVSGITGRMAEERYLSKVTRIVKGSPVKDVMHETPISGDELRRASGEVYTGRKAK